MIRLILLLLFFSFSASGEECVHCTRYDSEIKIPEIKELNQAIRGELSCQDRTPEEKSEEYIRFLDNHIDAIIEETDSLYAYFATVDNRDEMVRGNLKFQSTLDKILREVVGAMPGGMGSIVSGMMGDIRPVSEMRDAVSKATDPLHQLENITANVKEYLRAIKNRLDDRNVRRAVLCGFSSFNPWMLSDVEAIQSCEAHGFKRNFLTCKDLESIKSEAANKKILNRYKSNIAHTVATSIEVKKGSRKGSAKFHLYITIEEDQPLRLSSTWDFHSFASEAVLCTMARNPRFRESHPPYRVRESVPLSELNLPLTIRYRPDYNADTSRRVFFYEQNIDSNGHQVGAIENPYGEEAMFPTNGFDDGFIIPPSTSKIRGIAKRIRASYLNVPLAMLAENCPGV